MEVYVAAVRLRNAGLINAGIYRLGMRLLAPGLLDEQVATVVYHENGVRGTPSMVYTCRGRQLSAKTTNIPRDTSSVNGSCYSSAFQIDYEEEDVDLNESVVFHVNATAIELQVAPPTRLLVALEFFSKDSGHFKMIETHVVDLIGDQCGLNEACIIFFNSPEYGCAVLDLTVLSAALVFVLPHNASMLATVAGGIQSASRNPAERFQVVRSIGRLVAPFASSLALLEEVVVRQGLSPALKGGNVKVSLTAMTLQAQDEDSDKTMETKALATSQDARAANISLKADESRNETLEGLEVSLDLPLTSIEQLCNQEEAKEKNDSARRVLLFNSVMRNFMSNPKLIGDQLKAKWKIRARDLAAELFIREKLGKDQLLAEQDSTSRTRDYRTIADKLRLAPRFTDWDVNARPLTGKRTFNDESGRPVVFEQRCEILADGSGRNESRRASSGAVETPALNEGIHLVVLLHGFMGSKWDLRVFCLALTALDIPGLRLKVIESNEVASEWSLQDQGINVAGEIISFVMGKNVTKLSFVGYSMGAVVARVALNQPVMRQFDDRLHTFVSIAGPHLGTLGSDSNLVGFGQWALMKWKKIKSLEQLGLEDDFLLKLSEQSDTLARFNHFALVSSSDDTYVPPYSARIELPKGNKSQLVEQMQKNLVDKALSKVKRLSRIEMSFEFASRRTARARVDAFLGRAAHVHVLDSLPLTLTLILIFASEWFL